MANQGPYPQPPEPAPKKSSNTCLILVLVTLALFVPIVGVVAALGIYGMRRYAGSAKTAEAKYTVASIARAAQAAYERESPTGAHALCSSATPVPRTGPLPAKKYMPSTAAGQDFNSGSEDAGWKCLRFSVTAPMYYQFHYHAGSGWIAPSQAPGPHGFEAAALGDLDGNGKHSTFARTGAVSGDKVTLSTSMYIDNEFE